MFSVGKQDVLAKGLKLSTEKGSTWEGFSKSSYSVPKNSHKNNMLLMNIE